MPATLHAHLVNGRFGDAVLYVRRRFERSALLFDLGDLAALAPRQLLDIDHVFVSHAHVDHFIGFDRLLRMLVGRHKKVGIWGPVGLAERVGHKLHAYEWNLVAEFRWDLVFVVTEIGEGGALRRVAFRLKQAFRPEEQDVPALCDGVILRRPAFRVHAAVLAHGVPCLGFAVTETARGNVWKSRLEAEGLPVGPWLRELKQAILEGRPDDHPVAVPHSEEARRTMPLAALRHLVTVTPGQKIAYVTDVADTPENRRSIADLAREADILFIESAFAAEDAAAAAKRAHLTTTAAGEIARLAEARRVEPFHFSARYNGQEARMLDEVAAAFTGRDPDAWSDAMTAGAQTMSGDGSSA